MTRAGVPAMPAAAPALPAAFVRTFTHALSRRLWDVPGPWAAEAVERLVAGCGDPTRRRELAAFARRVAELEPPVRGDVAIALNPDQVRSKLWLIDELANRCDLARASLVVLGAWYGVLPLLMTWRLARPPERMLCVDVDPVVNEIGAALVGASRPAIEYRTADLTALDHAEVAALPSPVLVNTSCEHVADLATWWARVPAGLLCAVQSTNFRTCPEHVNCVDGVEELARQAPMAERRFAGVLRLPAMERYMVIGRR